MILCRSCGRAFDGVRTPGIALIACPADACQRWATEYADSLRMGAEPPPEWGMVVRSAPPPAVTRLAWKIRTSSRTVTVRYQREAHANELREEMREQAALATRGVETIRAKALS